MTDEEIVEIGAKAAYETNPEIARVCEPTTETNPSYRMVDRVVPWEEALEHNRALFRGFSRAVLAAVRPVIEVRERAIFAKWQDYSHMQLHAGEMTAQERRSVKAVLDCVEYELTTIRAQQAHDEPQEK